MFCMSNKLGRFLESFIFKYKSDESVLNYDNESRVTVGQYNQPKFVALHAFSKFRPYAST